LFWAAHLDRRQMQAPGHHRMALQEPTPADTPLRPGSALAAHPEAAVTICEGEKTADAAAKLFPEEVAVTSMGGSRAVSKADWTPLLGGNVTVFGDNDAAGRRYVQDVVRLLHGVCSIRVVRIPEGWPEGWDLADPIPAD
jgi:putative DNA primase/helicase